jgi:beta-glucanase (GH16 family)
MSLVDLRPGQRWRVALGGALLAAAGACGGGGSGGSNGGNPTPANIAPVAAAGTSQTVAVGARAYLDGSNSSDANGDPLSYTWSITARPSRSSATLSNAGSASPSFVADQPGSYTIQLIVNDGKADSAVATTVVVATPVNAPPGYLLVWTDEFDVDGLPDPTRWDYDTDRNLLGWFNHELQYYARDRPENARVSGGKLIITARKEALNSRPDWGGQQYSSARLVTRGKADWTYGFVEARAKLPCGRGTWPAIWTLGSRGAWPDDGEIDIMEQVGSDPTRVLGTVHTLQSGAVGTGGEIRIADACTAFHNYQLTWTSSEILIGVDDVNYYRLSRSGGGYAAWPFDYPQYLLLNIAIGGDLGGAVDDAIFPVTLELDYVRVFQKP